MWFSICKAVITTPSIFRLFVPQNRPILQSYIDYGRCLCDIPGITAWFLFFPKLFWLVPALPLMSGTTRSFSRAWRRQNIARKCGSVGIRAGLTFKINKTALIFTLYFKTIQTSIKITKDHSNNQRNCLKINHCKHRFVQFVILLLSMSTDCSRWCCGILQVIIWVLPTTDWGTLA